jgi:predicted membrane protein
MILGSVITGFLVKSTWLLATYLGVNALINQNYIVPIFYITGGVIGDYLSFKVRIK